MQLAVLFGVAGALIPARAFLADHEVETRCRPLRFQLDGVLLRGGKPMLVRHDDQCGRQGQVAFHRQAVEAGPRIEVVEFDGPEPGARAALDHRGEGRDDLGAGGLGASVQCGLIGPIGIGHRLAVGAAQHRVRMFELPTFELAGLGLEAVDVADRVEPEGGRRGRIAHHHDHPLGRLVGATELVVELAVGRWQRPTDGTAGLHGSAGREQASGNHDGQTLHHRS